MYIFISCQGLGVIFVILFFSAGVFGWIFGLFCLGTKWKMKRNEWNSYYTNRPTTCSMLTIRQMLRVKLHYWTFTCDWAGLGDFSLGLSEEPVQGEWSIVVKQGDNEEMNSFTVEEYVLPKFEVTITPPTFVTINTTNITVQLCAK